MLKQISEKFSRRSSLTSLEVYDLLIQKRKNIGKFLGFDTLSENFTPLNVIFFILLADSFSYIAINMNSVVVFKDDFVKTIFCLVTLGLCLESFV